MSTKITRRSFIKAAGVGAGAFLFSGTVHPAPIQTDGIAEGPLIRDVMPQLEARAAGNIRPAIRGDLLQNPKAVFIIRTTVKAEKDAKGTFDSAGPQIEEAGHLVASALFEKGNQKGGKISINPNWTYIAPECRHSTIGITVAPQFVGGFADGLKELGGTNIVVSERSGGSKMLAEAGHLDIIASHGVLFIDGMYKKFEDYRKDELNWFTIKNGLVWNKVPVFRPHFDHDTLTINMPKLKNHNLGLTTLSIKNMQGYVATGFGHYCDQWHQFYTMRPEARDYIKEDYWQNIEKGFLRHRAAGFKYWDYENSYNEYQKKGGWDAFKKVRKDRKQADEFMKGIRNLMWDEQWGQRTIDTLSALKPPINIVEGVIGRDGDGFANGTDYLVNYVIAGLDEVAVDTIAAYLMGQDPRELYHLRIANERGYGTNDPERIPVYLIEGKSIRKVADIRSLERAKLGVFLHSDMKTGLKFF
jgi:uncharacterized protein (DUF362 family)